MRNVQQAKFHALAVACRHFVSLYNLDFVAIAPSVFLKTFRLAMASTFGWPSESYSVKEHQSTF